MSDGYDTTVQHPLKISQNDELILAIVPLYEVHTLHIINS
jgi:hypothetical protein